MKYPYPTHLKRLQAACTLILLVACGDPEGGPEPVYNQGDMPSTADMSNTQDMSNMQDMPGTEEDMTGTEEDMTGTEEDMPSTEEDMPGTEEDMPVDMSEISVETCEFPNPGQYIGQCDVVRAQGCSGGESCLPAQQVMGEQAVVVGACLVPEREHVLQEMESCAGTEQRCAPGHLCFFGTCRKLCYLDGGLGCDDEADVCRQPSESWPGLGYCASACVGPG
ncbi:hypothetical protein FRD01_12545 [Microvenator marinus]|uniref:Uncharacterized protein n=1 Tax=Microvenator marinus TaxID=2600177 RepID=A0A5B8XX89_9DELT|nr:hypothetical protein [Microvenator marinus]QED28049.1 hypothetical protein FRD01_12545 [Microvenator marinus]